MFYIIFNNQTKLIVSARFDNSTPNPSPPEFWMEDFVSTHDASAAEHTIVVHPNNNAQVVLGRDKYDPDTKTIFFDPNWVAPAPTPAPARPALNTEPTA
jgi:hypothetical protein